MKKLFLFILVGVAIIAFNCTQNSKKNIDLSSTSLYYNQNFEDNRCFFYNDDSKYLDLFLDDDNECDEQENSIVYPIGGFISINDMQGNYFHAYTDAYGNTTGYDSNGNFYNSYTDAYGNTTGYDSNGNFYNSYTDAYGNTTGYDSNGNFYSASIDCLGNSELMVY